MVVPEPGIRYPKSHTQRSELSLERKILSASHEDQNKVVAGRFENAARIGRQIDAADER
jgi:hypothetical protein